MSSEFEIRSLIFWVKLIGGIVTIIGTLFGIGTQLLKWIHARRTSKLLKNGLNADLYSEYIIKRSIQYYVEPDWQREDPAGAEEPCLAMKTEGNLFKFMDDILNDKTQYKYISLLGDTGMGKSSFLLNYYARHLKRYRSKYAIALFPLGIPDVDDRISNVQQSENTVLFLDALDEDTKAIDDHAKRLRDIVRITRNFKKVVITCRTQFFPNEENIPKKTGIKKVGPRDLGVGAEHQFLPLYLSPFSDEQVEAHLRRRYSIFRLKQRNKILNIVKKIPNLIVRPMLLSYINDLALRPDEEIHYSFQLYEKIVEAWLDREEGTFEGIKKELLREFSEKLALDLFLNREKRGAEQIKYDEVVELAKEWNIKLKGWQITGRSLLNRDAVGNYKFAHRSIMEYLIVKKFTEGDWLSIEIDWTNQMKTFLKEMVQFYRCGESVPSYKVRINSILCLKLRSSPLENLEVPTVIEMLKNYDFFDKNSHYKGYGIDHLYGLKEEYGQKVVIDYATGLMWQQSGSDTGMYYEEATGYVDYLNSKEVTCDREWRLPTVDEAMSLMERTINGDGLYIDSMFDRMQKTCWTSDKENAFCAWAVFFGYGYSDYYDTRNNNFFVRAVR